MALERELSFSGVIVHLLLALGLWGMGVVTGRALLPIAGKGPSNLETFALAGPWGLVFLIAAIAAIRTRGASMLTPIPLLQLVLCAFLYLQGRRGRAGAGGGLEAGVPGRDVGTPGRCYSGWQLALGFAAVALLVQLVHRVGCLPYRGSGRWLLPFHDYPFWAVFARQLAREGVETYGAMTISPLSGHGEPQLYLYHYAELWLTGWVAEWFGLNPLTTLLFVIYPLFVGMIAFACAALTAAFLPQKRWAGPAGLAAVVVTTLAGYGFDLPLTLCSFPALYYKNYCVGIALVLSGLVHALRRRYLLAAAALACAVLTGPAFLPLILAGTVLFSLWGVFDYAKGSRRPDAVYLGVLAAGMTGGLFLWTKWTGHALPPSLLVKEPVSRLALVWRTVSLTAVPLFGGVALGFPLLLGLWIIGRTSRSHPADPYAARLVAVLCLCMWAASPFAFAALSGGGDAGYHILWLMWAAFSVPVGWAGLCLMLAEGPRRWAAAGLMAALLFFGVAGLVICYREEQVTPYVMEFSPKDAAELRKVCEGQVVGYFAVEEKGDEMWWFPKHMSWAALADCKMVRLNELEQDHRPSREGCWQHAAPMAYARSHGLEWKNTPPIILGFARTHGIQLIAEYSGEPIPKDIRSHLESVAQAGPFNLYRILPPSSAAK